MRPWRHPEVCLRRHESGEEGEQLRFSYVNSGKGRDVRRRPIGAERFRQGGQNSMPVVASADPREYRCAPDVVLAALFADEPATRDR